MAASVQAYRKAQAAAQAPQSELWKDAEYRKARLAQIRISMAASYPELTSELGFSQTEVERVLDLLAEYQMNMDSTLSSLDRTGGRIVVTQEMGDRLQEFSRQRDQALSTALGPARYAQWQQYERDYPARSQVNALNAMLARAGQPMNAAQLKSMTEVLVEAMRQQPQSAETTQRIMTAASRLLSAPQIELVRAQFEQQAALSQAVAGARERAAAAQSTRETP